MTEVDSVVPITVACATPPCVDTYSMPLRPGSSFVPETIAASESAMWCLVFSATFAGSGRSIAFAMYADSERIIGDGATAFPGPLTARTPIRHRR